jgi:putative membrane protein
MLRGMDVVASVLVGPVAALHLYFLVLEMFLWTKQLGIRTFDNPPEFAEASRVLAADQGLYNGFLVAGLVWVWSTGGTTSACSS